MTEIPKLGLGTWPMSGGEARRAVAMALDMGYRHVDTAQMYGNEAEVGQGIADSDVPREEVFVVTKVHQDRFGEGTALDSARRSVDALGGPADLMLCHWPPRDVGPEAVMDGLMEIRDAGLTRLIGISNFNRPQMRAAAARGPVATNQVEFHALIDQTALLEEAGGLGIPLTAYMPIARGRVLDAPEVTEIATAHDATPAQVALAWILAMGVIAVPKSARAEGLRENLGALDLSLSEAEMARLTDLSRRHDERFCRMANWEPDWDAA